MPDTIPSANMSMPVPVVGVDPGPQYATDLNSCITILDGHNHSSGSGVQITPDGLSISSDLPYGNNNATELRSVRFDVQASPLALAADLGCLYVSGVDLYYNDENGNQIRITASGAVAGTPGSISGLAAPASASYNSGTGTFIFQSGANIPGNLDGASLIIREQALGANGITLSSPAALAANYNIQLPPSLPASQKFVTLDASGNLRAPWAVDNSTLEIASSTTLQVKDLGITGAKIAAGTITGAKIDSLTITGANIAAATITQDKLAARAVGTTVAAGGVAQSASSASYVSPGGGQQTITGLTVTITTTGRPVWVGFVPVQGATASGFYIFRAGTANVFSTISITQGANSWNTPIGGTGTGAGTFAFYIPPHLIGTVDTTVNGVAGTYTYVGKENTTAGDLNVTDVRLVAYEL